MKKIFNEKHRLPAKFVLHTGIIFLSDLLKSAFAVTEKPGNSSFSHAQTLQAMEAKRLKKNYHKLSVAHYMFKVETGETVDSKRVYTPCDITLVISVPVPGRGKSHFGATLLPN